MGKCMPREITKAIPDVQTVVLPVHWFNNLNEKAKRSVFTFVISNGGDLKKRIKGKKNPRI